MKQDAERLKHVNAVLKAIRKVNKLILSENDPLRLIEQVCIQLMENMGYDNAWIALLGGDPARSLGLPSEKPVAGIASAGCARCFEPMQKELREGAFPACMRAVLEQKDAFLVIGNPVKECQECPLSGQYKNRESLICRLEFKGVTWGILVASVPAEFSRDSEEEYLFREIAGDLAFALQKIASEREQTAHRRYLSLVIEGSGIGTWEWNVQTQEVRLGEQWASMLGYTLKDLSPYDYHTWVRMVHPEDISRTLQAQQDCISGKTSDYHCEFRMHHKQGHWIWILDQGRVMTYDVNGKPLAMCGTHTDITKQKQMQESLRESAQRMQAVFDSVDGVPIQGYDAERRVIFWNTASEKLYGYPKEEAMGRRLEDLIIPDEAREPVVEGIRRWHDQEVPIPAGEVELQHKNGEKLQVYSNHVMILNGSGEKEMFCIDVDLTHIREARRKLTENEQKLRNIVETSSNLFYSHTPDYVMTYISPQVKDILGYEVEEALRNCTEFFTDHPENQRGILLTQKAIETGQAQPVYEVQLRHKEGHPVWVEVRESPVYEDGKTIAITGSLTDITKRKEATQTMEKSLALLNESQALGHIGSWEYDIVEDRILWSDEMYRIAGIEVGADLPGWEKMCASFPHDWESLNAAVQRAIQNGIPYEEDFRILWPDGSVHWGRVQGSPVQDENGNVVRLIGTTQDITQRKQTEEEQELLRSQLLQSQKMESVGRLAGGVAHDFNNMLGVIIMHSDLMLLDLPDDAPLRRDIEEIRKAATRSADLTRQLLAFARKQSVTPKIIDLNKTVEGMLKMLQRLIGENISINWSPGEALWMTKIDPSQVDQILANLCVNARDAIGQVGEVSIRTGNVVMDALDCMDHPDARPGEYVMLEVRDNGCGMSAEDLNMIFEPFFTTKELGKGTGLGLSTVYGVMQQNKGFIKVSSELGSGTTFSIYLLRHRNKTERIQKHEESPASQPGHETVLLVEDETSILELAGIFLKEQGYTVLSASRPSEAIRLATEYSGDIQLLITDVVMPEMNGRDLAKKVLSLYPELKRLFMSGYTGDVISQHGLIEEEIHFLHKPFSGKDLIGKVQEVLNATE